MAASAGVLTHAPMTLNVAFGRSYRPFNSGFVVSPDDRSWPIVPIQHLNKKAALRVVEEHQTPINDEGVCHGIHSIPRTLE